MILTQSIFVGPQGFEKSYLIIIIVTGIKVQCRGRNECLFVCVLSNLKHVILSQNCAVNKRWDCLFVLCSFSCLIHDGENHRTFITLVWLQEIGIAYIYCWSKCSQVTTHISLLMWKQLKMSLFLYPAWVYQLINIRIMLTKVFTLLVIFRTLNKTTGSVLRPPTFQFQYI